MRELERSLSVLQESELRDILSEYEQHIDMKVKKRAVGGGGRPLRILEAFRS